MCILVLYVVGQKGSVSVVHVCAGVLYHVHALTHKLLCHNVQSSSHVFFCPFFNIKTFINALIHSLLFAFILFSSRLSGLSPFMGHNYVETMTNVTHNKYDFEDEAFDCVTDQAKDFIQKLLVLDKR